MALVALLSDRTDPMNQGLTAAAAGQTDRVSVRPPHTYLPAATTAARKTVLPTMTPSPGPSSSVVVPLCPDPVGMLSLPRWYCPVVGSQWQNYLLDRCCHMAVARTVSHRYQADQCKVGNRPGPAHVALPVERKDLRRSVASHRTPA